MQRKTVKPKGFEKSPADDDQGVKEGSAADKKRDSKESKHLTTKVRKAMPKSEFGLPGKAPGKGSYPMPDKKHAAVAKGYAKRFASPAEQKEIDAKANQVLGKGKSRKG